MKYLILLRLLKNSIQIDILRKFNNDKMLKRELRKKKFEKK